MPFGYRSLFENEIDHQLLSLFITLERTQQNLSLNELAKIVGIDASYLSALEKGKKSPSDVVVQSIFEALDIHFSLSHSSFFVSNLSRFYRLVHSDQFDEQLYQQLIDESYYYSLDYPYVIFCKALVKDRVENASLDENLLAQLHAIYPLVDNSVKIAINRLFVKQYDSSDVKGMDTFYHKVELENLSHKCNDILSSLPFGIFYLHKAYYEADQNRILRCYDDLKTFEAIFNQEIYVYGLLAAKELKAKLYALTEDNDKAIDCYKDLLHSSYVQEIPNGINEYKLTIAILYFDELNYQEAINYSSLVVNSDQYNLLANLIMALSYYHLNDVCLDRYLSGLVGTDLEVIVQFIHSLSSDDINEFDQSLNILLECSDDYRVAELIKPIAYTKYLEANKYKEALSYC